VFVLLVAGLLAASPFSSAARAGLIALAGVYVAAAAIGGALAARHDGLIVAAQTAACFPALHFGYGVGTLSGLAREAWNRAGFGRTRSLSFPSR
jgi:hypothetical protein